MAPEYLRRGIRQQRLAFDNRPSMLFKVARRLYMTAESLHRTCGSDKEIATDLGISYDTVGQYLRDLFLVTGAKNRTELALFFERGYIEESYRPSHKENVVQNAS